MSLNFDPVNFGQLAARGRQIHQYMRKNYPNVKQGSAQYIAITRTDPYIQQNILGRSPPGSFGRSKIPESGWGPTLPPSKEDRASNPFNPQWENQIRQENNMTDWDKMKPWLYAGGGVLLLILLTK